MPDTLATSHARLPAGVRTALAAALINIVVDLWLLTRVELFDCVAGLACIVDIPYAAGLLFDICVIAGSGIAMLRGSQSAPAGLFWYSAGKTCLLTILIALVAGGLAVGSPAGLAVVLGWSAALVAYHQGLRATRQSRSGRRSPSPWLSSAPCACWVRSRLRRTGPSLEVPTNTFTEVSAANPDYSGLPGETYRHLGLPRPDQPKRHRRLDDGDALSPARAP